MLKSDAITKFCPFKMGLMNASHKERLCDGTKCIAWEELKDGIFEEIKNTGGIITSRKRIGAKPKDPEQGYCGMIPPEL